MNKRGLVSVTGAYCDIARMAALSAWSAHPLGYNVGLMRNRSDLIVCLVMGLVHLKRRLSRERRNAMTATIARTMSWSTARVCIVRGLMKRDAV